MREKFLAQYFEFYETLKLDLWNSDRHTNKNPVE